MHGASSLLDRRQFLAAGAAALAATAWGAQGASADSLIASIGPSNLWDNSDGQGTTWFHPRACMVPDGKGGRSALMTLQSIGGSDFFGPVHWTESHDFGRSWSEPAPIPSLGQFPVPEEEGLRRGVCDVVPEHHPSTNTVLALGHVVFYRGERYAKADQLARYPVYAVRDAEGRWSDAHRLEWDDPRGAFIYSNNCGQRVTLPDGDILLAFTFSPRDEPRSVAGVRCAFDGKRLSIKEVGPALTNSAGRGLLEPSVTQFQNQFYITIRAEDERGYVSRSEDGVNWRPQQAWTWEDGEPLSMSTTQQHWLTHSDGLFLVYTRKHPSNEKVIRWRSPLFVAQVDPKRLVLLRETERVVQPLIGDGVKAPDDVPLMGNFHVTNAGPDESWVTVGSWLPRRQAKGTVHLSRIRWSRTNRLA